MHFPKGCAVIDMFKYMTNNDCIYALIGQVDLFQVELDVAIAANQVGRLVLRGQGANGPCHGRLRREMDRSTVHELGPFPQ